MPVPQLPCGLCTSTLILRLFAQALAVVRVNILASDLSQDAQNYLASSTLASGPRHDRQDTLLP